MLISPREASENMIKSSIISSSLPVARWLTVSGQPRFDPRGVFVGYWGVGRDITTQRAAELVLEDARG